MSDISEAMGGDFATDSVEPSTGFDPIPAGWYPMQIDAAGVKDTKAGTGKMLAMELTVIGDQFAGRKLWPRLNIVNPNPKAVEIAMRELAALGQACGLAAITDSSELLGKMIMGKVKVRQDEGREPDNEVQGYKPMEGAETQAAPAAKPPPAAARPPAKPEAPKAAAPAKPAATAPAKPSGKRPWER